MSTASSRTIAHEQSGERKNVFVGQPGSHIGIWIVSVTGTPYVIAEWADPWFVAVWIVIHTIVYWGYIFGSQRSEPGRLRAARFGSSVIVWGSIPVSAVVAGSYRTHEALVLLVCFAFVSFRAIVPLDDRRFVWERDGLFVGAITASCSFFAGHIGFGIAALAAAIVYRMAERAQLALHAEADVREAAMTRANDRMKELAYTDQLTGLANRRAAVEWVAAHDHGEATVALIDIDKFKHINDRYGHQIGDQALQQVATVVKDQLGSQWTFFRFGGDEFIGFAHGQHDIPSSSFMSISIAANSPDGSAVRVDVSVSAGVGTFTFPYALDDALELVGPALRLAKRKDGVAVEMRKPGPAAHPAHVLHALDSGEFTWWGQPIVDLRTGYPVAVELLCRWPRKNGTTGTPDEFLSGISAAHRLRDLGRLNIVEVNRWLKALDAVGFVDTRLHINIAPTHLSDGLLADLDALLDRRLWPRLAVEILESEILHLDELASATLAALSENGVQVLIDDFGAGHSTLLSLSEVPFDGVKLDRALVHEIDGQQRKQAIVRGITPVFSDLGAITIAEGVETSAEFSECLYAGVTQAQGWLLAEPQPLERCMSALTAMVEAAADVDRSLHSQIHG